MYCFDVSHHQIIILSLMTLLENNKLFTIWETKQKVLIGFISEFTTRTTRCKRSVKLSFFYHHIQLTALQIR